jgi:predicted Zn-dependent protease
MTAARLAVLSTIALSACSASPSPRAPVVDAGASLFARAMERSRHGDSVRAEQYLVAALSRGYPEDVAVPALTRICIAGLRLRAALSYAEPYSVRHPRDVALTQLVAAVHWALGEPERARGILDGLVTSRPEYAPARYFLGILLRDALADPEAASAQLAAYLGRAPDGEHAAEARAWLEEYATRPTIGPMTPSRAHGSPSRSPSLGPRVLAPARLGVPGRSLGE